jgi:peptidoglycan/xylan/chitin deacetylase (PgdA/CDA1 family)
MDDTTTPPHQSLERRRWPGALTLARQTTEIGRRALLRTLLRTGRTTKLFDLSRRLTADVLKIVCYHGFALDDEHEVDPRMFVSAATLRARMALLRDRGYRVISLEEGVERLVRGELEPDSVVITTDDGWHGTVSVGAPIFREFGFPNTLYVTTYYVQKQTPVYNYLLYHMFLRSPVERAELAHLLASVLERFRVSLAASETMLDRAIRAVDREVPFEARDDLLARVGEVLKVDYARLRESRMYHLLRPEDVAAVEKLGVDIQLHTHRHRLPHDETELRYEIDTNRGVLRELCRSSLRHFCYPSGRWREEHIQPLSSLGIRSATTCDRGMNRPRTHPLKLFRFLDGDHFSDLQFEAEVSGCKSLLRHVGAGFNQLFRGQPPVAARVPRPPQQPLELGVSALVLDAPPEALDARRPLSA